MKVIFLDFDGVITTPQSNSKAKERFIKETKLSCHFYKLDPRRVRRLDRVCKITGAKIVISSYWRVLFPLESLQKWLKAAGLHHGEVIGITPVHNTTRGIEILKAVRILQETGTLERWIAIDDDWQSSSLKNGNMWPLVDRDLVKTYFDSPPRTKGIGLTECLQKEMIQKLS